MADQTTPEQRREFYERHLRGETYQEIADSAGVSRECVRKWCRRQRDGGDTQTRYRREPAGLLGSFVAMVRYVILRLRLEHPRWGPSRIRIGLTKRPSLKGMRLPSEASIGRYLHRWERFRRKRAQQPQRERPQGVTEVHQCYQLDFKLQIEIDRGHSLVNLFTLYDPVGTGCMGANVFPAGQVGHKAKRPSHAQVQAFLRSCFAHWQTLPDRIQTDGEASLTGQPQDNWPSTFTLWLVGLGIQHVVTRPGRPTDNAAVERCHRTINDYAIVGHERADMDKMQQILNDAVYEMNFILPSRAKGCEGRAPVTAHPQLLQPRHPFQPEHELALFDLDRVDAYLVGFTWRRKVGKTGQITMVRQHGYYTVGRAYARRYVLVRFDPSDRHFVFYDEQAPNVEIGRRPAKDLEVADLTGLDTWPTGLGVQQLPLPLFASQGVRC
jgi:hypothetical protein